jgi:hypothetical protein
VERLAAADGPATPASDLYCGDHWQHAKQVTGAVGRWGGRAWVLSASYGLIPVTAPLHSYSATFTARDPDSVFGRSAPTSTEAGEWWDSLAEWPGPVPGSPRRLAGLASSDPDAALLVIASAAYLLAITPDLLAARGALSDPGRLIFVAAGAGPDHALTENMLPCNGTTQAVVGGPLASLNVRVAARLASVLPPARWSLASLREVIDGWRADAVPRGRVVRRSLDDAELRVLIRRALRETPSARPTSLLAGFRADGLACEQQRFARLFRAEAGE